MATQNFLLDLSIKTTTENIVLIKSHDDDEKL